MRRVIPRQGRAPSRRAVRNTLAVYQALHDNTAPVIEQAAVKPRTRKPRSEREAGASDALKEWRLMRADVRMWRNNVGVAQTRSGGYLRYGLCNGSADFIGLRSIVVSPGMVGKRIAVFLAIECKAPGKNADAHQDAWLQEVRDAGAIAGVARNAEQAEQLLTNWMERVTRHE
jgi:hypothetical protein